MPDERRLTHMAEVVVFGVVAAEVILRVPRIPAPGDQVNAEALGWRIGGSSANVACGLSGYDGFVCSPP
jgi:sugar/nucleoside kinase (ribokinase family)